MYNQGLRYDDAVDKALNWDKRAMIGSRGASGVQQVPNGALKFIIDAP